MYWLLMIVGVVAMLTSSTSAMQLYWCHEWTGSDEYTSVFGGVTAQVSQPCGGAFTNLYLHGKGYNLIDPYSGRAVQVAMWRTTPDACPNWPGLESGDNPTQGGYVDKIGVNCGDEHGNPASIWVYSGKTHYSGAAVNFVGGASTQWSFYGWLDNTANGNVSYIEYRQNWTYNGSVSLTQQKGEVVFFFNPELYYQKSAHLIVNGQDKGFITSDTTQHNVSWAAIYIPGDDAALIMIPTAPHTGQTVLYSGTSKRLFFRTYNYGNDALAAASFQYQGTIYPYSQNPAGSHVTIGLLMYVGSKSGVCGLGYCW